jgi:uncharacterized protein YdeI (BOF family)
MKRFKIIIVAFLIGAFSAGLFAQQKTEFCPKQNQEYADNKFVDAEAIIESVQNSLIKAAATLILKTVSTSKTV